MNKEQFKETHFTAISDLSEETGVTIEEATEKLWAYYVTFGDNDCQRITELARNVGAAVMSLFKKKDTKE